jgi:hypothetical protein
MRKWIACPHFPCREPLDCNSALHGIDRARKIGDDAVAGSVEDPPAMAGDQSVHHRAAGLEPDERPGLVQPHQPAVAGDVGGEDRGEFSFDRWDGHLAAPLGDGV